MDERSFDAGSLTRAAADTFTVRRVFGEPYERDGRVMVPVARVTGMTGSGAGRGDGDVGRADGDGRPEAAGRTARQGAHGTGDGGGGGFAARVRPLGVYELGDDGARWHPAVDVNRAIPGGQIAVTVVASVWALAWAVRRR
ncbi:hypothetical protein [Cellulomonas dongxiuzhuiae]|uniref:Sporulation protein n=1 Tax=Cellulomonas dongxiuzhuiae TaxID=2819979 RepID=A0ABX8GQK7_9CELL|nr:hypothetical protein [Cellulomonas dongxiuzhuiae]MBO3096215.1 hypothetical protein [Cellulomonas dongxiuzhuiae]QWC18041.1 hypothetical protein KKR89_07885 [Cellulomonas dongxiuzhuiae]